MSAILSADDLNDFISPGVACIKPVETLPQVKQENIDNPYEVTTEDNLPTQNLPAAQISLTDCLACSGCVTSAEAVLVSLQSHSEVLHALDSYPSVIPRSLQSTINGGLPDGAGGDDGKLFVASVSPQVRASLAATYGVTESEAGYMIEQLFSGSQGIRMGGQHGNGFTWVLDTNVARQACLVLGADEVANSITRPKQVDSPIEDGAATMQPKKPVMTSACPGWICYVEKTHPHIVSYLSRLKSPQALLGILLKTTLSRMLKISPEKIWHVAVMPCFDKKLEASREELTDVFWKHEEEAKQGVRDVDCVITTREVLMLADARGIRFADLPRRPLDESERIPFPDKQLDRFLFPRIQRDRRKPLSNPDSASGSSGGYLYHILQTYKAAHPGSDIIIERGRNADKIDYTLVRGGEVIIRAARYYGFRNIQNLVRSLKPAGKLLKGRKAVQLKDYAYVEVMACPGGCTNGGAQIKSTEVADINGTANGDMVKNGPAEQKEWQGRVDEAYFSAESSGDEAMAESDTATRGDQIVGDDPEDRINGISISYVRSMLDHWSALTGIDLQKLAYTSYRKVESDVGKSKLGDTERVVELAGRIGGG
ncbi:MAG: Cytosolic Fe-S cluster assembly factor nar1, partial [Candelina submexicana]